MRGGVRIFFIMASFLIASCAGPQRQPSLSEQYSDEIVLARVNQEPISYQEWAYAYKQRLNESKISQEAFLDEYINYKLGAQKAARLHLLNHPYVQYQLEWSVYDQFLKDQYRVSRVKDSFEKWKESFVNQLLGVSNVWISPEMFTGDLKNLPGQTVVLRINGEGITAESYYRLTKQYVKNGSTQERLNNLIQFKVVVSRAKTLGWFERPEIRVAKEKVLFQMANRVELGGDYLNPKAVKKLYEKERRKADVEVYSFGR